MTPDAERERAAEPDDYDDFDDFCDDLCWQCHGERVVYDCFEEWACVDPESGCDLCERRCDVCRPRKAHLAPASQGDGTEAAG